MGSGYTCSTCCYPSCISWRRGLWSNQEQYALKVNDQEISKSVILQEMGQFKDVLRKNYQGSIPPIYTDKFIKKITFDNLIRRSIENNISSDLGLVLSDDSIVDDIREYIFI